MQNVFLHITKVLFFILLQLKGIYSTQEVHLENDITTHLNEWVSKIFAIGGQNGIEIISKIYEHELNEFQCCNISNQEADINTKRIFQNIVFYAPKGHEYDGKKAQRINWTFSENKISLFFEGLNLHTKMLIRSGSGNVEKSLNVSVFAAFKNFTLTAVKSYTKDNDSNITYDINCTKVDYWGKNFWYLGGNSTAEGEKQLDLEIKPILPIILQESLKYNQKFTQKLDDVFQVHEKPRREIISAQPDFLNNSQKYYYLVPEIPFFCFVLKRIVIHGLWNFESYKVHGISGIFTHTLVVRNIRGSMTLDYRSEKEPDLELNFQMNCFVVSKKDDTGCVYGRAKYYTITRTNTNVPLDSVQSEVVMNELESAVASALLSSKRVGKTFDVEMPLEKIEISNSSDWKTIKESYKGWIPFNDDEIIKK
ncbi:uncharacterized protein LOC135837312 [Planococcus citri]|uniref:uncharacterized protein LOC135837312 n=1 Tax=Planococcus citri TaxID=170843 RepID=UPI0031F9BFD1